MNNNINLNSENVIELRLLIKQIYMVKECPKCRIEFDCMHNEIFKCHCSRVALNDEALKYIKENFKDCLCNKCLQEVAALFSKEKL